MPNFEDLNTQFPAYHIVFDSPWDTAPLTVAFTANSTSSGSASIDTQVQDFADAVATSWGTTVVSVRRLNVTETTL